MQRFVSGHLMCSFRCSHFYYRSIFVAELFPMTFEGIRLVINKGLSNHFFVSHSLLIGATSQTSNYKFGSTFVGTNQIGPGDFSPLLIGDIDPRGNISTNVNVQPWDNVKIKLNTRVVNHIIMIHCLKKIYIFM